MNQEHIEQLKQLTQQLSANSSKLDYNNKLTEELAQKISGVGSDLKAFKQEMKPWLEAKIGLNLLWRWGITIPIVVSVILGIKTIIIWLGFHK